MRILHILDHSLPKHSGYVFRTMSIIAEQKARGWDPVLLTTPRQGPNDALSETIDGWPFFRTPNNGAHHKLPPGFKDFREMRLTTRRLKSLIPEVKPDIIHAHSPVLNFFPANWAKDGIPIVYEVRAFWEDAAVDHGSTTEGSMRYNISRSMETRAFKRAAAVTTICEGLRSDIVARGIAANKVTVIPNAVDIDKFPPITERNDNLAKSLGLQNKQVLGFIGSFYAYEGLLFLVHALPMLIAQSPDIHLLLVGGGPDEKALRETVAQLKLDAHVTFTGRVPHEMVREYYSLADIMVYPRHSIRLTETVTPLKPLEAMAMKKLVLASDIGGHRELIENGKSGQLFKADDGDDFVRVCLDLLQKKDQWSHYHKAGRHYVENVRNWKNSVNRYEAVYTACLKSQ